MHAAYLRRASCVLTGDVVVGEVPSVDPMDATCADALFPDPQAVASRAIEVPRMASDRRGCI
jgi:hypothetical protein